MSAARASPAFSVAPLLSASCYGLADCNNFYASCETVIRPKLAGKTVIVLSNNDGCVIARSAAAKVLGVKMGQSAHELAYLIKRHDIIVCSANFALCGDMSARVMDVLARSAPRLLYRDRDYLTKRAKAGHKTAYDYAVERDQKALSWAIRVIVCYVPDEE